MVTVLRTRHLPLMKIHGCHSWTVASVLQITVDLIFESSFVRLITHLTIVTIYSSEDSRPRQASVIDLVIVAARMDF